MKSFGKCVSLLATVLALVLTSATTEADRREHDALIVFGDSLSDTGNLFIATKTANPPVSPIGIPPSESPNAFFFLGRFSNGLVGVEYLWELMKKDRSKPDDDVKPILAVKKIHEKGAVNFAFGGASSGELAPAPGVGPGPHPMVPGLHTQIDFFEDALGTKDGPKRALYVIFIGVNDYYRLPPPTSPPPPCPPTPSFVTTVVGNIVNAVGRLYERGARDVMVVNLPDLGVVPFFTDPTVKGWLKDLTICHNNALSLALSDLPDSMPGLEIIPVDAFRYVENNRPVNQIPAVETLGISWPPPSSGITFPVSACLFFNPSTCPNAPTFNVGPQYFFWDAQHPTTATHAAFGQFMYNSLPQP